MILQMRQAPAESGGAALITSRRNFLVRAFGLTAAGAAVTVPIVTVADARARVRHHLAGLEAAMRELHPGARIKSVWHTAGTVAFVPRRVPVDVHLASVTATIEGEAHHG